MFPISVATLRSQPMIHYLHNLEESVSKIAGLIAKNIQMIDSMQSEPQSRYCRFKQHIVIKSFAQTPVNMDRCVQSNLSIRCDCPYTWRSKYYTKNTSFSIFLNKCSARPCKFLCQFSQWDMHEIGSYRCVNKVNSRICMRSGVTSA